MKKLVQFVAFLTIFVGSMALGSYLDNTYTVNAMVAEKEGMKYFVDVRGEAWDDDRAESFTVGQDVRITFNKNVTESIYDDSILKVK